MRPLLPVIASAVIGGSLGFAGSVVGGHYGHPWLGMFASWAIVIPISIALGWRAAQ